MMLEIPYDCENDPSEAGWVDDYMCECWEDLGTHKDVELCPLRNQILGQQELETDSCTEQVTS